MVHSRCLNRFWRQITTPTLKPLNTVHIWDPKPHLRVDQDPSSNPKPYYHANARHNIWVPSLRDKVMPLLGVGSIERGFLPSMFLSFNVCVCSAPDTFIRKDRTPEIPQENRFLDTISHRDVFSLGRRQRGTLLRPRQRRNTGTSAHHHRTRKQTYLRSVALLAKAESTKSFNATPLLDRVRV